MEKLGKYKIISQLGKGAMGVVYKAVDPMIERIVALKTIRRDILDPEDAAEVLARFKREAQAAGRLTHPNIVTVYEYGEEGPTAYIAMEYVKGRSLKEILDKNQRFKINSVIKVMLQLLSALGYSHKHGVVHRDIKPGNIILLADGQIKVTDFGIARIESSNLTHFGDVMGTPSYMPPEQFMGHSVDNRSDLFSAGVIFYHLLTGEKPFPGNSMTTIMHRVINETPTSVSELNFQIPAALNTLINKAIAKRPSDRFQNAEEFIGQIKALELGQIKHTVVNNQPQTSGTDNEETIIAKADQDETIRQAATTPPPPVTTQSSPIRQRRKKGAADLGSNKKLLFPAIAAAVIIIASLLAWFFLHDSVPATITDTAKRRPPHAANHKTEAPASEKKKTITAKKQKSNKSKRQTNTRPNIRITAPPSATRQGNRTSKTGKGNTLTPRRSGTGISPLLKSSTIKPSPPTKKKPVLQHKSENKPKSKRYKIGGYGRMLNEEDW